MGCNQSTERKGAAAPVAQPEPQPVNQHDTIPAAVVVAEPAAPEQPVASPEVVSEPTDVTVCAAEPSIDVAREADKKDAVAADTADQTEATEPAPTPAVETAPLEQPAQLTIPVIPALALPRKRNSSLVKRTVASSRASSKNSRATPRLQKENAVNGKPKTPSKTQTVKRGLSMSTTANQQAVDSSAQKKVFFDAIPAQEDAATKRKNKAKKVAGKHGCNVNEELFLASIAAFERQLTHRASLNSQLNSR